MASLLITVIVAAIIFDYINGFHDAANAIATVVSTGVLSIRTAVLIAGALNFVGAMAGTAVAKTIASGFADPAIVTQTVVLAALIGAIVWNLITWWYGIPSSSSHALIGGLCGAVVAHAGVAAFKWSALGEKVLLPLVLSPTLGFIIAFFLMVALLWIVRRMRRKIQSSATITKNATMKPIVGERTSGISTFSMRADHLKAPEPACATTAPARPPTSACDELDGMPNHHVMRFQIEAPSRAASTQDWLTITGSANPEAMVFATAVPVTAPTKLSTAAMSTAVRMGSTPVDTTVAIAFAAS